MRTKRIKLYKFSELKTEAAKQKAIQWFRDGNQTDLAWQDENVEAMEKFANVFPVKVRKWAYGSYRNDGVSFDFTESEAIENLTGQRLATYIWNNYRYEIYSYKWYNGTQRTKPNEYYKTNAAAPEFTTWSRYSKIQLIEGNCPFTGYYMDNEILQPIFDFMRKPDNRDFKELLSDCFEAWIKACNADIEGQNSDESIADTLEANEYEFFEDGRRSCF